MKTERTLLIRVAGSGTLREATGDEILGVAREYILKRIRRGTTLASPMATRDYLMLQSHDIERRCVARTCRKFETAAEPTSV
jgi:DNA repair protein RadC